MRNRQAVQATLEDMYDPEAAALEFKRFILEETAAFMSEPEADLFRVNTLAQMLDRGDQYAVHVSNHKACIEYVLREFGDLPERMREQGFIEKEDGRYAARWPTLSEDDAAQFLRESSKKLHQKAIGIALMASCVFPILVGTAIDNAFNLWNEPFATLGVAGMFGMIGVGVYAVVANKKPKDQKKIEEGHFSLNKRLRVKLEKLREATSEKARRRKGKGAAMLAACALPILVGAALDSLFGIYDDWLAGLGVAGMFAMIGAGMYQLIMAGGEKKPLDQLLKD